MSENINIMYELQQFILLVISSFLGSFLAKFVKKHYLLPHEYSKKATLTATVFVPFVMIGLVAYLCFIQVLTWFILVDVVALYVFYLYSSFANSPSEFQNKELFKNK